MRILSSSGLAFCAVMWTSSSRSEAPPAGAQWQQLTMEKGSGTQPTPIGYAEIHFKNGSQVRGEIMSGTEERLELEIVEGDRLSLRWDWVEHVEVLGAATGFADRGRFAAEQGRHADAVKQFDQALELDIESMSPEQRQACEDLLQGQEVAAARVRRATIRKEAYRATDRLDIRGAYEILLAALNEEPNDVEWLNEAVRLEQKLGSGGEGGFRSDPLKRSLAVRLAKLDPESAVLAGIRGRQAVKRGMNDRFMAGRKIFLASAYDQVRDLFGARLYRRALGVIDHALMLSPDAELRSKLAPIEARARKAYDKQLVRQLNVEWQRAHALQGKLQKFVRGGSTRNAGVETELSRRQGIRVQVRTLGTGPRRNP